MGLDASFHWISQGLVQIELLFSLYCERRIMLRSKRPGSFLVCCWDMKIAVGVIFNTILSSHFRNNNKWSITTLRFIILDQIWMDFYEMYSFTYFFSLFLLRLLFFLRCLLFLSTALWGDWMWDYPGLLEWITSIQSVIFCVSCCIFFVKGYDCFRHVY